MSNKRTRNKNKKNAVETFKASERRRNIITVVIIGFVAAALLGSAIWSANKTSVDKNEKLIAPVAATKDYGVLYKPSDAGNTKVKDSDVKAHVVIWEDFSCPFCAQFEEASNETLLKLVEDGKADVEYRLTGFLDDLGAVGDHSKRAASASLCVLDDNGVVGWKKYHDWLYSNQPDEGSVGQTNNDFARGAKELGLKVDDKCFRAETYVPWMKNATERFRKDKIAGTPAVFVNGKKIESGPLPIVKAVDQANGLTE